MWNIFRVNNKDTRATPIKWFWCLYCKLWMDSAHYFDVSINDFEQVNADWIVCLKFVKILLTSWNPSRTKVIKQKQPPGGVLLKHLCQSLFFNKVAGIRPATLLKKRLRHSYFFVYFAKFLRTGYFLEHLRWLFLIEKTTNLHLLIYMTLLKCFAVSRLMNILVLTAIFARFGIHIKF